MHTLPTQRRLWSVRVEGTLQSFEHTYVVRGLLSVAAASQEEALAEALRTASSLSSTRASLA